MYSDSDGTGKRTRFIQTEGTPYRIRCPFIHVRSTCILDTSQHWATASSAAGRAPRMADASSEEPPSHTVSSAHAKLCSRPAGVGLGEHPRPDLPHGCAAQWGERTALAGARIKPSYGVVDIVRAAHVEAHVLH